MSTPIRTANKRGYEVDGEFYPSVTTILNAYPKPGLDGWRLKLCADHLMEAFRSTGAITPDDVKEAKRAHKRALDAAASVGLECHSAIESHLRGDSIPEMSDLARGCFNLYLGWFSGLKSAAPPLMEQILYSPTYRYAGTCDLIYLNDAGERVIVDFKTSGGIYDTYGLQLAAYRQAFQEVEKWPVARAGILRIGKGEARYEYREWAAEDLDRMFDVFLSVKDVWTYSSGDTSDSAYQKLSYLLAPLGLTDRQKRELRNFCARNTIDTSRIQEASFVALSDSWKAYLDGDCKSVAFDLIYRSLPRELVKEKVKR